MHYKIPQYIKQILEKLEQNEFKAYIVGGSVRDLLLNTIPKDWDIATSARPEQIQKIFTDSVYENEFGTVIVKTDNDPVEVTTFRADIGYKDMRHPDRVEFSDSIKDDLKRRDFTINAMAMFHVEHSKIIDPYEGQKDLEKKLIRAVGNPDTRFSEDALRMIRAVRFAVQLEFEIEENTKNAIKKLHRNIKYIAKERIKDELTKILTVKNPINSAKGIILLKDLGLLKYIIPEFYPGIGMEQPRHHIYTVFEHLVKSLENCVDNKLELRLAALLHDISKPRVAKQIKGIRTFYNHELVGAREVRKILRRLKFPNKVVDKVSHYVRHHMFYYNVGEITDAAVRRLIKRIGKENLEDLIKLRVADRLGSGCAKGMPHKLKELEVRMKEVQKDPISEKMLAIKGGDLIKEKIIEPGPDMGKILKSLLDLVLDDPSLNTRGILLQKAKDLSSKVEDINLEKTWNVEVSYKEFGLVKNESKKVLVLYPTKEQNFVKIKRKDKIILTDGNNELKLAVFKRKKYEDLRSLLFNENVNEVEPLAKGINHALSLYRGKEGKKGVVAVRFKIIRN